MWFAPTKTIKQENPMKKSTTAAKTESAPKGSPKPPSIKAKASGDKKPKAANSSQAAKPKRISALDAAATVLKKAGKPMRLQEMIEAMAKQGLWESPGGKTPHATLSAAILRETVTKGKEARFKKVERGQFEYNGGVK
jgi:hypothetical protein